VLLAAGVGAEITLAPAAVSGQDVLAVLEAGALFVPQTSAAYPYGAALIVANWLIGHHILTDGSPAPAATPSATAEPA
jgi:hypothetical protein